VGNETDTQQHKGDSSRGSAFTYFLPPQNLIQRPWLLFPPSKKVTVNTGAIRATAASGNRRSVQTNHGPEREIGRDYAPQKHKNGVT
jgi:hypothetical protein